MATDPPGDLPSPPTDLVDRSLPLVEVGSPWFRCHRRGREPIHFGRSGRGRYDDPEGTFGVLYVGLSARAAFVEVFGRELGITPAELGTKAMSLVVVPGTVRVVDLTGAALPGLRLDARVSSGRHTVSQRWSRAFHDHPDRPDGLLYRCRHDPSELALALYERGGWSFESSDLPGATMVALAAAYGLVVE